MLPLRHLHSAQCRKTKQLLVKDIVETYDFNGYKSYAKFESHPFYTNYIMKYKNHHNGSDKKPYNDQNSKPGDTDVNGNMTISGEEKLKIRKKNIERLSSYISEKSLIAHKESAFMPYSNFMENYYVKNLVRKDRKNNKQPHIVSFSGKCSSCQHVFNNKSTLAKHRILCQAKKMKSAAVKNFAKKLVKKVRNGKVEKPPRVLFPCSKCTDRFMSKSALESHLKYDHRPRPTCEKCMKMFDCRRKLVDHERVCASLLDGLPSVKQTLGVIDFKATKELHICIKCENPFPSSVGLQQHKILLNKRNPLDIQITLEPPIIPQEKIEIFIKKTPFYFQIKQPNPYVNNDCPKCGKVFQNQMRLNQHFGFCHEKTQKCCPFCLKKFRGLYHRNQHIDFCTEWKHKNGSSLVKVALENTTTGQMFKCCTCDISFPTVSQLNQHLKTEHQQHYCYNCSKLFHNFIVKYAGSHFCLNQQKVIFTTAKNVPYSGFCHDCSGKINVRAFNKPFIHQCSSLKATERLQTKKVSINIIRNQCLSCKSCFSSSQKLMQHQQTVSDSKLFHCNICPCMTFSKLLHMTRHMKTKHSVVYCAKCNKTFSQSITHNCVNSLLSTETSSSSCICYICGFNWSGSNLFEHLALIHSAMYPYCCDLCDNVFKLAVSLQKHYDAQHGECLVVDNTDETLLQKHNICLCKECDIYHINQESVRIHSCTKQSLNKKRKNPQKTKSLQKSSPLVNSNGYHVADTYSVGFCYLCRCKSSLLAKYKMENGNVENLCQNCSDGLPLSYDDNPPLEFVRSPIKRIKNFIRKSRNSTEDSQLKGSGVTLKQEFDSFNTDVADDATGIKPVGPSFEACLYSNPICESTEEICGEVMTLKEAEESLKSLIVDDDLNGNESTSSAVNPVVKSCPDDACVDGNERNSLLDVLLTQKRIPMKLITKPEQPGQIQHSNQIKSDLSTSESDLLKTENKVIESNKMVDEASELDDIKIIETFRIFPCKLCDVNFDCSRSFELHLEHQHNIEVVEVLPPQKKTKIYRELHDNQKESVVTSLQICRPSYSPVQSDATSLQICRPSYTSVQSDATSPQICRPPYSPVQSDMTSPEICRPSHSPVQSDQIKINHYKLVENGNSSIEVTNHEDSFIDGDDKNADQVTPTNLSETYLAGSSKICDKTRSRFSDQFERSVKSQPSFPHKTATETRYQNGYNIVARDTVEAELNQPDTQYLLTGSRSVPKDYLRKKEKYKPYDREQVLLEKMLRKTNERNDVKTLRQSKAPVLSTNSNGSLDCAGAEYNNGISNYFNDIMLKSNLKKRHENSDYLSALRHRIRKQFESEGRWRAPSKDDTRHSHLRRTSMLTQSSKRSMNGFIPRTEVNKFDEQPIVNNPKENGKPKLLFNPKNLDELRKKIRRKSTEQTQSDDVTSNAQLNGDNLDETRIELNGDNLDETRIELNGDNLDETRENNTLLRDECSSDSRKQPSQPSTNDEFSDYRPKDCDSFSFLEDY